MLLPATTETSRPARSANRSTRPVRSAKKRTICSGADLLRFHARTQKPIGIFGATTDSFNFTNFADGGASTDVQALRACRFVFTRERTSLRLMDGEDVDGPDGAAQDNPKTTINETTNRAPITVDLRGLNKAFVPDTTFAFPVRDDASADVFMKTHGLEEGRFVCFLPRHCWTPTDSPTRQGESRKAYNDYYAKEDHSWPSRPTSARPGTRWRWSRKQSMPWTCSVRG